MRHCLTFFLLAGLAGWSCVAASAQAQLSPETQQKIDKLATDALAKSGVPSASVAVVKDGQIAYLHAYGSASIDPAVAAKPEMRYSIGSISKQFTAAAIFFCRSKASSRSTTKSASIFLTSLAADDVTIRQLLSHTSGLSGFLAARLRYADDASAGDAAEDSGRMGAQAARFRSWDEVAVQQHELCDRWPDCGEGERDAATAILTRKDFHAAGDEERCGHRPGEAGRHRSQPATCDMRWGRCIRHRRKAKAGCLPPGSWPCLRKIWRSGIFRSSIRS